MQDLSPMHRGQELVLGHTMNPHTSKALGMWERGNYREEIGKNIKPGSQCKTEPIELGKQIIVDSCF